MLPIESITTISFILTCNFTFQQHLFYSCPESIFVVITWNNSPISWPISRSGCEPRVGWATMAPTSTYFLANYSSHATQAHEPCVLSTKCRLLMLLFCVPLFLAFLCRMLWSCLLKRMFFFFLALSPIFVVVGLSLLIQRAQPLTQPSCGARSLPNTNCYSSLRCMCCRVRALGHLKV